MTSKRFQFGLVKDFHLFNFVTKNYEFGEIKNNFKYETYNENGLSKITKPSNTLVIKNVKDSKKILLFEIV